MTSWCSAMSQVSDLVCANAKGQSDSIRVLVVESLEEELPDTRFGVGTGSLCSPDLVPLHELSVLLALH